MPAVLRPDVLRGVGATVTGDAPHVEHRLTQLGATQGHDVLVHASAPPTHAEHALEAAWHAIRAHALPPDHSDGLIVLIAPPPGDAQHAAARAGLENLARTLSVEWARFNLRPVTILPGTQTQPHDTAELVAFLASAAGAYYAGCAFTLR
jgi:hypothetical protein